MEFIDRKAIGLEQYFAKRSSAFADLNDFTGAELQSRLEEFPWRIRFPLAQLIRLSFEQLKEDGYELEEYIPHELRERYLSRTDGDCSAKQLMPFFEWLLEIQRVNEQAKVNHLSELNNCAMRLDAQSRAFFRNFFALNNQRVVVAVEGGTVTLLSAERAWGRAKAVFEGCEYSGTPGMPLLGFAFGLECVMRDDGRFDVNMLIDTEFGDVEYHERLLSERGWQEFSFVCSDMKAQPECFDYVGRMVRLGTPRFELIEKACSLLIGKKNVMGKELLTAGEREMLHIAEFVSGAIGLLGRENAMPEEYNEELVVEALDNRHAISRFKQLLSDCGCEQLCKRLDEAEEACYEEAGETAIKKSEGFAIELEKCASNGTARTLLYKLEESLIKMTAELSTEPYREKAERRIIERVQRAVQPALKSLGFGGEFPHYRRLRGNNMEYISIMLDAHNERPQRGVMSYYASLAAAKISLERCEKLRMGGIAYESTNALDCLPESLSVSPYGELAGADDKEYIQIDVNCYAGEESSVTRDESERIPHYISIAEEQFTNGRIPKYYRWARLRSMRMSDVFVRAFMEYLPYGVLASIVMLMAYLLWLRDAYFSAMPPLLACLIALSVGFMVILVMSVARCFKRSFLLWRY